MNKILHKIYPSILPLFVSTLAICVFIIGIGRYRVVVALIIYFFIKALLKYYSIDISKYEKLYFPILILMIIFDYKFGQIYPVFSKSDPIVALLIVIFSEILLSKHIKSLIENVSNGEIFTLCQKCGYDMTDFAEKCNNCGYILKNITNKNKYIDHNNHGRSKIFKNVKLEDGEKILKIIKLDRLTGKSIYVDNKKLILSYMIITNINIILLFVNSFGRGWKYKQIIHKNEINDIKISDKFYINKTIPVLSIITNENIFDLYCVYFSSGAEKLNKLMQYIKMR